MKLARFVPPLLISVSLLAASCESPPDDGSSKSSRPKQREEATATAQPTEMTGEETTPAPEKTVENAAREGATGERAAREGQKGGTEQRVVEVQIRGLEYLPGPIKVSPGTTVRWVNEDRALHTVTSEGPGGPLESEELERGDAYEYTFREPGQYDYYCVVHPFMKSGVTVG
ncbi:MAG TPA: cupredoxin family copper-binding protein [Rubrobacter sp.]|nr:cupredoxin family copper-binding protein [Rubrobacter sp.]